MVLPTVFLIHSTTLTGKRRNYTLAYDGGTAAFTAGKTLTGATSHATAIIVSTGAVGSGTLTLHTITGTFANDEAISDNGTIPGAAVVNGTISDALDGYGQISYTDLVSTVACRLFPGNTTYRNGQVIVVSPRILIPASITPALHDTLTTTAVGFEGTLNISSKPKPVYEPTQDDISHWSCEIAAGV